jgi:D-alanyl-D-alanine carboxypeptidase
MLQRHYFVRKVPKITHLRDALAALPCDTVLARNVATAVICAVGKLNVGRTGTHENVAVASERRLKSIVLFVLPGLISFLTLLSTLSCGTDSQGDSGFSDDTVERLDDAIAKQMQENDLPGVVVGVWVTGKGEYVVARGKANLKTGEERDLDDQFRIASITKTFIATAILQLVEEGKLSKTDKLSKWYPEFPNAEKITVGHLLRMRSGIVDPDYEDVIHRYTYTEEVIKASASRGSTFLPPGQSSQYNNVNYILLGEIISKVSGNETGDQLAQSILKPLDLKNTIYPTTNDLPGNLRGYTYSFSTADLKDTTNLNPTPIDGADSMISNMSDLKTWAKAVCTGRLLKPETQKARLQTQQLSAAPDFAEYGEGIEKAGKFCGHSGQIPGFNTAMWYLPEKDATFVVNVNRLDRYSEPPAELILVDIIEILFPKYVPR